MNSYCVVCGRLTRNAIKYYTGSVSIYYEFLCTPCIIWKHEYPVALKRMKNEVTNSSKQVQSQTI